MSALTPKAEVLGDAGNVSSDDPIRRLRALETQEVGCSAFAVRELLAASAARSRHPALARVRARYFGRLPPPVPRRAKLRFLLKSGESLFVAIQRRSKEWASASALAPKPDTPDSA